MAAILTPVFRLQYLAEDSGHDIYIASGEDPSGKPNAEHTRIPHGLFPQRVAVRFRSS